MGGGFVGVGSCSGTEERHVATCYGEADARFCEVIFGESLLNEFGQWCGVEIVCEAELFGGGDEAVDVGIETEYVGVKCLHGFEDAD